MTTVERVRVFLADHPDGATIPAIARSLRVRDLDVRTAVEAVGLPVERRGRAKVVVLVPTRPATGEKVSQGATMLAMLRERPRTSLELNRAFIGRPNSRAAVLRRDGHLITCERVPGKTGAASYLYRLLSEPAVETDPRSPSSVEAAGSLSGPVELRPPRTAAAVTADDLPVRSGEGRSIGGFEPVAPAGREAEPGTPSPTLTAGSAA